MNPTRIGHTKRIGFGYYAPTRLPRPTKSSNGTEYTAKNAVADTNTVRFYIDRQNPLAARPYMNSLVGFLQKLEVVNENRMLIPDKAHSLTDQMERPLTFEDHNLETVFRQYSDLRSDYMYVEIGQAFRELAAATQPAE